MTNDELRTALSVMQHRLNELDRLTDVVADLCGAAEDVLQHANYALGTREYDDCEWLKRKLQAAYRAGIPPRKKS